MALRMYETFCENVKGGDSGQLVKMRPIGASYLTSAVSGRVVSLDTDGTFRLGLANNRSMPLFLFKGVDQPSVYAPATSGGNTYWVGNATFADSTMGIAFVATGGFEIQTTEFDTSRTYGCNTLLTVNKTTGVVTDENATVYTNIIVGVCSVHVNNQNNQDAFVSGQPPRGRNANNRETLTFWSTFIPAATG